MEDPLYRDSFPPTFIPPLERFDTKGGDDGGVGQC